MRCTLVLAEPPASQWSTPGCLLAPVPQIPLLARISLPTARIDARMADGELVTPVRRTANMDSRQGCRTAIVGSPVFLEDFNENSIATGAVLSRPTF